MRGCLVESHWFHTHTQKNERKNEKNMGDPGH